jgi:hypothetical protein
MMNKLETVPSGAADDKSRMMETIESKIMSLQSQLREVRQQRETGTMPRDPASGGGRAYRGGGRAVRGRGRGRGRSVNKSADFRSKAIVVSDAPSGLTEAAHQHFSR